MLVCICSSCFSLSGSICHFFFVFMVPILTKRNVIYGSSTMNKEEEERNTLLQAAYIIRTFFCHEARELVKKKRRRKGELLSFFLLLFPLFFFLSVLRTMAIVPEESYCYLTIQNSRRDRKTQQKSEVRAEKQESNKRKEEKRTEI